jgi:hypothetical protein
LENDENIKGTIIIQITKEIFNKIKKAADAKTEYSNASASASSSASKTEGSNASASASSSASKTEGSNASASASSSASKNQDSTAPYRRYRINKNENINGILANCFNRYWRTLYFDKVHDQYFQ